MARLFDKAVEVCMRVIIVMMVLAPAVWAEESPRHAERAGLPKIPKLHTAERAGTDAAASHLQPSNPPRAVLGYVNGTTFGKDYVGIFHKPGRVFPGFWPSRQKSFSDKYSTDGPIHVPDPIAAQPIRRAVKEALAKFRGEGHGEHEKHEKHEKHDEHQKHDQHDQHDKHDDHQRPEGHGKPADAGKPAKLPDHK